MASETVVVDDSPLVIGATGLDAIRQNLRIIVLTSAFSVPLDRAFAVQDSAIDAPDPYKSARIIGEIISLIEKYEPRVAVESVNFRELTSSQRMTGLVCPIIKFSLREGVTL